MNPNWIADRMHKIDASGIRKVFDLAAQLKDPINLSIGQPHFGVPEPVQQALFDAVRAGKNAYSPSQGIAPLIDRIQQQVSREYGHADRKVFISSGTSGALVLVLQTLVNPGDEVIVFDPWFVMYRHLVTLAGGTVVDIDTYPDFRIDVNKVAEAITPRTKLILFNSPGNPTGAITPAREVEQLAKLAREKDIVLVSDEIYRMFSYGEPFASPAAWNPDTIVIDGFSKSHSMTGWRVGWVHGPEAIIQQMIKLQQFTFVCAPHPMQHAALTAWETDMSSHVADYAKKRDYMRQELGNDFELHGADGAFYLFPKAPWGTGTEFVTEAIRNNLLIIPGKVFSQADTHFRLSYAADDRTLERGCEMLRKLARQGRSLS